MPTNVYINFSEGKGIDTFVPDPIEKPKEQEEPEKTEEEKPSKHFDEDKRLLLKNGGFNNKDIEDMERREYN